MKVKDITGIKPRNPKQITKSGLSLVAGMIFLPLIPFKKKGKLKIKIGK